MILLPIFPTKRATVKTIHLARCTLVRARAGIEVITRRTVRIARSVTLVEQTGVLSNTHTFETNLRGRWRKDRKLKLKRRTTKTTTPGNDTRQSTSGHVARTAQIGNWVNAETGEEVY